jgi:hypothetical protein
LIREELRLDEITGKDSDYSTQCKKLLRIRFVDSHICNSFCQTGLTGFNGFLFVSQLPEEAEKT